MLIGASVKIHGVITKEESLSGRLSKEASLSGSIFKTTTYAAYTGPYDVTPDMDEKTMATKDRYMNNNVTVKAIPVYSVTNQSGGNTVTIGGLISYG